MGEGCCFGGAEGYGLHLLSESALYRIFRSEKSLPRAYSGTKEGVVTDGAEWVPLHRAHIGAYWIAAFVVGHLALGFFHCRLIVFVIVEGFGMSGSGWDNFGPEGEVRECESRAQ